MPLRTIATCGSSQLEVPAYAFKFEGNHYRNENMRPRSAFVDLQTVFQRTVERHSKEYYSIDIRCSPTTGFQSRWLCPSSAGVDRLKLLWPCWWSERHCKDSSSIGLIQVQQKSLQVNLQTFSAEVSGLLGD